MTVQPDDAKIGRQIDLKKHSAEMKLTKSNKITDCQRRFFDRVEKKELPSLREWIGKQEKLFEEIKKKIEVANFYDRSATISTRSTSIQATKVLSMQVSLIVLKD